MKRIIQGAFRAVGIEVRRVPVKAPTDMPGVASGHTDLDALARAAERVPGMTTTEQGRLLYALCLVQPLRGDVVEIGSWQGRSTMFLGQAVRDSNNGHLHAIDHFQGNPGKGHLYRVGRDDLGDLEGNFRRNIAAQHLSDIVTLHPCPVDAAAPGIADASVRFLFVDGDHSARGVRRDLEAFWPKLVPGATIVFDDHTHHFPGVVATVAELAAHVEPERAFSSHGQFILTLPTDAVPRLPRRVAVG